jgi:tellurite resistance protein TehA-like permease
LDLFTFGCFIILTITKYTVYPGAWHSLLRNPATSLYAGCFPMGAATLITVAVKLFHDHAKFGGNDFLVFLWAMWWINVGISFICCWLGVHIMYAPAPSFEVESHHSR